MARKFDKGLPYSNTPAWNIAAGNTSTEASKRLAKQGKSKESSAAFMRAVDYKSKAGNAGRQAMTPWEGLQYELNRTNYSKKKK